VGNARDDHLKRCFSHDNHAMIVKTAREAHSRQQHRYTETSDVARALISAILRLSATWR
jgi:hypothetical protein